MVRVLPRDESPVVEAFDERLARGSQSRVRNRRVEFEPGPQKQLQTNGRVTAKTNKNDWRVVYGVHYCAEALSKKH